MSEEQYRLVAKGLRRLLALESIARAGAEEMHDLTSTVCQRVNQASGADVPMLEVNPPAFKTGQWSIAFRGSDTLDFAVSLGSSPGIPGAVAKCTVGYHYSIPPIHRAPDLAAFHYVKTNDHGAWQQVSSDLDDATPVNDGMILDLIMRSVNDGLRIYTR